MPACLLLLGMWPLHDAAQNVTNHASSHTVHAKCCLQAKVHPEQPGYSVDREAFERIWFHSVDLLQRGFRTGSILTVDPEDAQSLGKPWTRRWEPFTPWTRRRKST